MEAARPHSVPGLTGLWPPLTTTCRACLQKKSPTDGPALSSVPYPSFHLSAISAVLLRCRKAGMPAFRHQGGTADNATKKTQKKHQHRPMLQDAEDQSLGDGLVTASPKVTLPQCISASSRVLLHLGFETYYGMVHTEQCALGRHGAGRRR